MARRPFREENLDLDQQIEGPKDVTAQYRDMAEQVTQRFEAGEFDRAIESPQQARQDAEEARKKAAERERELLTLEAQRQRQQREEFIRAAQDHRLPRAVGASPFDGMGAGDVMLDEDGTPAGTPGYVKRRVRMVDSTLRMSNLRIQEFARWGYRPIKSRVSGKTLADERGIYMEAPPERDGERRAFYGRRVVSETLADRKQQFESAIDSANRELGQEAFRPYTSSDHTAGR
jgi:hypothetical protein